MTLIDILSRRATRPEPEPAVRFLVDGDVDGERVEWSANELHLRAIGVAEHLRALGQVDRPVLLVYPPGLDFVAGFLGCLYARALPVPVYPPNPSDLARATSRIRAVADDCGATILLTTEPLRQMAVMFGDALAALARFEWVATDTLPLGVSHGWRPPEVAETTPAFLQYTSGSTGSPKGVVVRHAELAFHLAACQRSLGFERHMVSWLPAYHDMGLIGGILCPLAVGVPTTMMAPHAFLMKPSRWMRAISHFRADVTAGPNFGYHLAARKASPAELEGLDLTCLRVAVIGAEPISPKMLEDFLRVFEPVGLSPRALYPAYGMAEATLMISTKREPTLPKVVAFDRLALARGVAVAAGSDTLATALVGCGETVREQSVIIVDPDTQARLPDGRIGEVLVSGPSVAAAYWRRPESADEVFAVAVRGEPLRYLRTGDSGFFHEGELYIAGRLKDLIIIRGRNYAPADIEASVEQAVGDAWGLRPGRVVAVSVPGDDGEVLVVLAEGRDDKRPGAHRELADAVARVVAENHGIQLHTFVLLQRGAIPLTSSGKVQRRGSRAAYLEGSLAEIARMVLVSEPPAPVVLPPVYGPLTYVHEKLDTRASDYLFDLDHDVPWEQLDAPGVYLPAGLLTLFGVDPAPLARRRDVYRVFQWAAAMAICRTFEQLEWGIIQFARLSAGALERTTSMDNLCQEEEKHIRLFRRIATHLAAARPDLMGPFTQAYADNFSFLKGIFASAQGAELHQRIWLTTLFFEPATLHMAEEFAATEEPMQPVWLAAHALHAQEEQIHVPTVAEYAKALQLPAEVRERIGASFIADMQRGFHHLYGLTGPIELVRTLFPDVPLGVEAGVPPQFVDELLHSRTFRPLARMLPGLGALPSVLPPAPERPRVIFVHSSERSGSTLLRVMLSAHPELFAPPEMNLLGYATLGERAVRLPAVQQGGLVDAIAALPGHDAASAAERVAGWVHANTPTEAVYAYLLEAIGDRVLVDKSPIYSRDLVALRRAEAIFGAGARHVHLSRHPYAVIDSYARVGLDRLVADRLTGEADPIALGEMGWTLSNRTVRAFLAEVPTERWCSVQFEDLVVDPGGETARLCAFLRLPYSARVLAPYTHGQMLEGVGAAVGDPNFQKHRGIDPALGDAWRKVRLPRPLGREARRVAAELGYPLEADTAPIVAAADGGAGAGAAGGPASESIRAAVLETVAMTTRRPATTLADDTAFSSLGLDSLALVQLTNALETRLGRVLPAMTLYDHPTIGRLLGWLGQGGGVAAPVAAATVPKLEAPVVHVETHDLVADVWLPEEVNASAPRATASDVFLTGATGFLGAYLLRDLLTTSAVTVYCLVRAPDTDTGLRRLRENLESYGVWEEGFAARIRVVLGDLGAPRLGIDAATFDALAAEIGVVLHNGALLRFGQGYDALAPSNVAGTREVFRLATRTTLKTVLHVSSMAVFDTFGHWDGRVDEGTPLDDWRGIRLPYAQTKWVADRLASLAASRGVPVTIFRCAGIAGDQRSGAWNTTDLVCRMLQGCVAMGVAPSLAFDLDMAPVDYVSGALVRLAATRPPGGVYHLNHPTPITWKRFVAWMQFRGFSLDLVAYPAWVERLQLEARRPEHPLAALVSFLSTRLSPDGLTQLETREHRPRVGCAATGEALRAEGITCPPIDHALMGRWVERFIHDGFLPAP